jgi:agmatinase
MKEGFPLLATSPFMGIRCDGPPQAQIVGFPYEATSSFRSGSRFAPNAIRKYADSLETYSPYRQRDLADIALADLGNLNFEDTLYVLIPNHLDELRLWCAKIRSRAFTLFLGGEHTSSLAFISEEDAADPGFLILVLDAHLDLRDTYQGTPYSHASWLRRALERLGPERVILAGARSGTQEEFRLAREVGILAPRPRAILSLLEERRPRRIHLSIDIDVLDPSVAPGTGNPEPMGWQVADVMELLEYLTAWNVVSADLVEYSPPYDPSGKTGIVAAFLARELLLAFAG